MKIKHGNVEPTLENLKEGQLGYFEKDLWINTGEKVIPIFRKHPKIITIDWEPSEDDVRYIKTINNATKPLDMQDNCVYLNDIIRMNNYNVFNVIPFNSAMPTQILDYFSMLDVELFIPLNNFSFICIELRDKNNILLALLYFGFLRYVYHDSSWGQINTYLKYPHYPLSFIWLPESPSAQVTVSVKGRLRDEFDINSAQFIDDRTNRVYNINGSQANFGDKRKLGKYSDIFSRTFGQEVGKFCLLNQMYLKGNSNDASIRRAFTSVTSSGILNNVETDQNMGTNYRPGEPGTGIKDYISLDLTRINGNYLNPFNIIINHPKLKNPVEISWDPRWYISTLTAEYSQNKEDQGNARDKTLFYALGKGTFNPFNENYRSCVKYNFKFTGFEKGKLTPLKPWELGGSRNLADAVLKIED